MHAHTHLSTPPMNTPYQYTPSTHPITLSPPLSTPTYFHSPPPSPSSTSYIYPLHLPPPGDQLNTSVTGPGATVALGLIYIKSKNLEIAKRLHLPHTAFALDSVRPDLLLYRAMAKCLVLWDDIGITEGWIDAQVPLVVRQALFGGTPVATAGGGGRGGKTLDVRTAFVVYLNVISGLCWGMGLVYAGKNPPLHDQHQHHY